MARRTKKHVDRSTREFLRDLADWIDTAVKHMDLPERRVRFTQGMGTTPPEALAQYTKALRQVAEEPRD